ncbi:MAG: hypothetical protein EBQ96_01130 [Proteobacteria bacterium]|nr:hypothetical protein [Pseudomonadota bacterium]
MNIEEQPPITDQEIRQFVWGPPSTQRLFDTVGFIGKIASPAGLTQMGMQVAYGYVPTGRLDLLMGGSLLVLLGVAIADISFGKNHLSRIFSRALSVAARNPVQISQPTILAAAGIASCLVLAGGEIANYLSQTGVTLRELTTSTDSWGKFVASASYPKIMANIAPFLAASAIDIPAVRNTMDRVLEPVNTSLIQNGLGVAGATMIGVFAQKAGLPAFEIAASLQAMGSISATLASMYLFFSPRFFLPHTKSINEELIFLTRVAIAGKQDVLERERDAMMNARGHMTPGMKRRINKRRRSVDIA